MKKRILLAIVAASLMLQTCPILVSAEQIPSDVSITEVDEDPVGRNVLLTGTCSKTDEDNVKWEVEKDEVSGTLKLIISGEGEMRPTRASEEEEGYRLTETVERQLRDQNLIDGNTYIEEVVICEGVKTVGGLSFSKMKKISLPEGLEVIDSEALFYCEELKEIKIPDSVKEIREFSLYGCKKLEKIDLPERDIQFGEKAFGWCRSLKELRIPEGVKKIYCNLWDWTDSLQKVYLPHSLEKFYEDFMKYTMTESFPALKDLYYNGTMDDWEKVEKYTFGDDRVEADGDESLMWKRIYHDYYLGDVTKHFQGTLFTGDCSNSSNDHVKWEAVMDKETGILKLIISGEGEMRGVFEEEELGFPNHVEGVLRNNHLLDANTHIEEIIICEGVKNVNGLQNNIEKKYRFLKDLNGLTDCLYLNLKKLKK